MTKAEMLDVDGEIHSLLTERNTGIVFNQNVAFNPLFSSANFWLMSLDLWVFHFSFFFFYWGLSSYLCICFLYEFKYLLCVVHRLTYNCEDAVRGETLRWCNECKVPSPKPTESTNDWCDTHTHTKHLHCTDKKQLLQHSWEVVHCHSMHHSAASWR